MREAEAYGWGGVSAVSQATGMSRITVEKGSTELAARARNPRVPVSSRIRQPGGGRKTLSEADPQLFATLEQLIDPMTRGDPMSPIRWTCLSTSQLAGALSRQGHVLSPRSVGRLLNEAHYSLQGNRKAQEGGKHPDRNAQFEHINTSVQEFQHRGQPVISVDQEEGAGGSLQKRGTRVAPAGAARRGQGT